MILPAVERMAPIQRHTGCYGLSPGIHREKRHMKRWPPGRRLLVGVAIATTIGGYAIDWNRTHLYNPRWTGHAKFHDAQTILHGSLSGGSALILLLRTSGDPGLRLRIASGILAIFWLSMAGSILLPNTTQADPDFADLIPTIAGVRIGPTAASLMMLALTAAGYYLEASRIKARQTLLSTGVV
jgi:hypothetical protein